MIGIDTYYCNIRLLKIWFFKCGPLDRVFCVSKRLNIKANCHNIKSNILKFRSSEWKTAFLQLKRLLLDLTICLWYFGWKANNFKFKKQCLLCFFKWYSIDGTRRNRKITKKLHLSMCTEKKYCNGFFKTLIFFSTLNFNLKDLRWRMDERMIV